MSLVAGGFSSVLATVALICGTFGAFHCDTMRIPTVVDEDSYISVGPWSYRTNNYYVDTDTEQIWVVKTCRSYKHLEDDLGGSYDLDSKSRAVMGLSIVATVLGGLGVIASYVKLCSSDGSEISSSSASAYKALGGLFLLVTLFQGLTLMLQSASICLDNPIMQFLDDLLPIVGSKIFADECKWGSGYKAIISSVVFWGVAALCALAVKASSPVSTESESNKENPPEAAMQQNENEKEVEEVVGDAAQEEEVEVK